MSGWNLPPGCTDLDIEIAQGAVVACSVCGRYFEPDEDADMSEPVCNRAMCRDPDSLREEQQDRQIRSEP